MPKKPIEEEQQVGPAVDWDKTGKPPVPEESVGPVIDWDGKQE